MALNRKFAKLDTENLIVYAPDWVIRVDHHHDEWIDPETGEKHESDWDTERRELHPDADDYAHAKDGPWWPVDDTKPEKLGVYFVSTEFGDLVDGRIVRRYDERPIVAPPVVNRHWTKLKLKTALATAGWLAQVKAILGGIEIAPGYSAAEAFADCDYIEERWPDEERWNAMLDGIAAQLGKTRAEIDAFLDNVPTDNGEVAA